MMNPPHDLSDPTASRGRTRRFLARLGVWGFVFFLVKGLAWLVVPALLAIGLND